VNKDGDRAGARQSLRYFLCDHAGFPDADNDHLAVTIGEQIDGAADTRLIEPIRGAFDRRGFES
jgi:hypothetical protein